MLDYLLVIYHYDCEFLAADMLVCFVMQQSPVDVLHLQVEFKVCWELILLLVLYFIYRMDVLFTRPYQG